MLTCNTITIKKMKARYALAVDVIADNEKLIADSGCTSHFLSRDAQFTNIEACTPGVTVRLPNNMSMKASHTVLLNMPHLPRAARQCHLFLDMGNKALLSLAQFCDNGYRAIFTIEKLLIEQETDPNKSFKGCRDPRTRMWTINLLQVATHPLPEQEHHSNSDQQENNIYAFTLKRDIV